MKNNIKILLKIIFKKISFINVINFKLRINENVKRTTINKNIKKKYLIKTSQLKVWRDLRKLKFNRWKNWWIRINKKKIDVNVIK